MSIYLTQEQNESWQAYKLGYEAHEWRRWIAEHATIFGHTPTPDFDSGEPCSHPMHAEITMLVNGGYVHTMRPEIVPYSTIVTEDDAEIDPRFGTREYEERIAPGWGDALREIEE